MTKNLCFQNTVLYKQEKKGQKILAPIIFYLPPLSLQHSHQTQILPNQEILAFWLHIFEKKRLIFNYSNWKTKNQKNFKRRFNIPHITYIFSYACSIPSTLYLKLRTLAVEYFVGGYPSDEE